MLVYLVRHSNAVERGAAGAKIQEIWTSPLVRAYQTAVLLADELMLASQLKTVAALAPDGDFETMLAELAAHADLAGVALVGHEPYLGEFTSYILSGSRGWGISFKKGGVACVEIEDFRSP